MQILTLLAFIIGSCLGSFFKLVVDRYETSDSIIFKSSYCFNCKNILQWWQNIPILSFLILKGKCHFCKSKIDASCFYSELITGFVSLFIFVSAYSKKENLFEIILLLIFSMVLVLLSLFDLKHRIVPHVITYTTIIFIIILRIILKQPISSSFVSLGVAFIAMDFLYFFVTTFKKFELELNLIVIPLIIWFVGFFFCRNLFFLFVPIVLYFLLVYNLKISMKVFILFWLTLFLLLMCQIYRIVILSFDLDKLVIFFSGVGIIYFVCEILFYFFNLFFPFKSPSSIPNTPNQKVTIGGGDITVFALINVFLGCKVGFFALFIASLLAVLSQFICKVVSPLLKCRNEFHSQYVPFVPYLSVACFIIIITKW